MLIADSKAGNIVSFKPPGRLLHGEVPPGGVVAGGGQIGVPVVLRLLEVVEHVLVAPARVAEVAPLVVVAAVAADVEHVVEDGGAAEDATPGPVAPPALVPQTRAPRLWLRLVLPVELAWRRHTGYLNTALAPSAHPAGGCWRGWARRWPRTRRARPPAAARATPGSRSVCLQPPRRPSRRL